MGGGRSRGRKVKGSREEGENRGEGARGWEREGEEGDETRESQ